MIWKHVDGNSSHLFHSWSAVPLRQGNFPQQTSYSSPSKSGYNSFFVSSRYYTCSFVAVVISGPSILTLPWMTNNLYSGLSRRTLLKTYTQLFHYWLYTYSAPHSCPQGNSISTYQNSKVYIYTYSNSTICCKYIAYMILLQLKTNVIRANTIASTFQSANFLPYTKIGIMMNC